MKKGNSYRNRFPDNNLQYIYWLVNVTISDVIFHYEFLANSNSTYLVSNTGYKCLDVQLCGTALLTGCISTFKTSAMLVTKIIFYRLSNTWEKINLYNNNNNNCINSNEIKNIQHYVHYLHYVKAIWGRQCGDTTLCDVIHFKTLYKENKRDLQHQGKQATRIIIQVNIICK